MPADLHAALPPGSVVGILGGGQLGRMLALAGARLGLRAHVFCPEAGAPALQVTPLATVAAYEDEATLARFAAAVDVVTYEFENVPARTASFLADLKPVRPGPGALAVAQDRLTEKSFAAGLGIGTAPFADVASEAQARAAFASLGGGTAILKTRRFGYDGKGQAKVATAEACARAFADLGGAECILEGFIAFERELSVIVARDVGGRIEAYDVVANTHRDHILHTSRVPAGIGASTESRALEVARHLVAALDYVGVLGVELFATPDGRVLFNEMAPRVHNSGHWTADACAVGQFEQHMRAVAGWPLASPRRYADAEMTNLIGSEAGEWATLAAEPGLALYLYGKAEARPGRKMGHVTRLTPRRG